METNSKQTAAADAALHASPTCFVCKKPKADDQWFCRLTQKVKEVTGPQATRILLCSPICALCYFAALKTDPARNTEAKTTTS
jgi:hypothetical protein